VKPGLHDFGSQPLDYPIALWYWSTFMICKWIPGVVFYHGWSYMDGGFKPFFPKK
jgi:hypothetical protein